jgi:hypothetical protein
MSAAGSSLPAADAGEPATTLLMAFDGKTVFLRRELSNELPNEKGRVYLVKIAGTATAEPPPERMTWTEYQAWIDRLRGAGFTLTTHVFSPCQR